MAESQIRLSIEQGGRGADTHFWWVLQKTAPVEDLCVGVEHWPSRAEALADFQRVCAALGWRNDITEVPVR